MMDILPAVLVFFAIPAFVAITQCQYWVDREYVEKDAKASQET